MTRKTKSILAALTVAASLAATSVSAFAFSDVSEWHWAKQPIEELNSAGYISGYEDGNFYPSNAISRAEFVTIINNIMGNTYLSDIKYNDVSPYAWYADSISRAVAAGYISGYADGTIKPDAMLTRAEAAVIAYRAWKLSPEGSLKFADNEKIGNWAAAQIATLSSKNIINGYDDNTFRPDSFISRAEVANIIYRLTEMEKTVKETQSGAMNKVGISNTLVRAIR